MATRTPFSRRKEMHRSPVRHVEYLAPEQKNYFWLEIEVLPTDRIVREVNGGRLRTMVYPGEKGLGMGMELQLESKFLKKRTEKGALKRGWPAGLVRIWKVDMGLMKEYLRKYKGTGRLFATNIGLNGIL